MNWAHEWDLGSSPHPPHKPGPHLTHFLHHAVALLLSTQQAELLTCETVWHRSQRGGEERFQGVNKTSPTWPVEGERFIAAKSHQEQHAMVKTASVWDVLQVGAVPLGWTPWAEKHRATAFPVHDLVQQTLLSVCPPPHSPAKAHPWVQEQNEFDRWSAPHHQELAALKALRKNVLVMLEFLPQILQASKVLLGHLISTISSRTCSAAATGFFQHYYEFSWF